jgi:hypothetical protein
MAAQARSFYIKRIRIEDGHIGWTGSLRPYARALREAKAWRDAGWEVEVVPNTPAVRREVQKWQRERDAALGRA